MDRTNETDPSMHEDAEGKISKVSGYTLLDYILLASLHVLMCCVFAHRELMINA